ncbi:MAG: Gmad2 immunoglobulin-like domain-containing protein, partial [Terracoccus sp.]
VESDLRASMAAEAASITPGDRLGAILAGGATSGAPARAVAARRGWLLPAAAAAGVAAVVAGSFWLTHRPTEQPPFVAATTAVPTTPTTPATPTSDAGPSTVPTITPSRPTPTVPPPLVVPTTAPKPPTTTAAPTTTAPPTTTTPPPPPPTTTAPTTPAPPTTTAAPSVTSVVLPVYHLGPVAPTSSTLRLFREFAQGEVGTPVTPDDRGLAALAAAMGSAPGGSSYLDPWSSVTPLAVTVGADAITVRLSTGLTGVSDGEARLAVQQLVWTVQGAVGKGLLPVTFELADKGGEVAPGQPTDRTYTQPTGDAVLDEVSPVWVDDPTRGGTVTAGAVTVTGVASTFEAAVSWQLLSGGKPVQSGTATADAAAPARGSYSFDTKPAAAGDYVIRVWATSAKDGSVTAEQRIPFTVG